MVINTESNILLFQFENIKWQYFLERAKQRKNKEKEDREENLSEVMSKASTPIHKLGSSISSKYLVAQESLLSKSHKSRVLLLPSRTTTGKRTDSQGHQSGTQWSRSQAARTSFFMGYFVQWFLDDINPTFKGRWEQFSLIHQFVSQLRDSPDF